MGVRVIACVFGAIIAASCSAHPAVYGRSASAPCPDVEVVFARGTGAPPGLGRTGTAFVDALRRQVEGKSIAAYPVDYPASWNFSKSAPVGARDAGDRIAYMATTCPDTRMVLGGVSQGAGVVDLMLMAASSFGQFKSVPLPQEMADSVAAVAVFGNPSRNLAGAGPLNEISPLYDARSIDLCADGDPFCSHGTNFFAHLAYVENGMVDEAATFVASRL